MSSDPNSPTSHRQPVPLQWVENLFEHMHSCYGAKFAQLWQCTDTSTVKKVWAAELGKLTVEDLNRGLAALVMCKWPPTLPEYIALCKKPGITPAAAYAEAIAGLNARERGEIGSWSHPSIYFAATCMSFELRQEHYAAIKPRWEAVLEKEMLKGEWPSILKPTLAYSPSAEKIRPSSEEAERMLKKLGAAGMLQKKQDHRAWIARVFQRLQRGDSSLPGIAVGFAHQAIKGLGRK
jgi:hypothetical protein